MKKLLRVLAVGSFLVSGCAVTLSSRCPTARQVIEAKVGGRGRVLSCHVKYYPDCKEMVDACWVLDYRTGRVIERYAFARHCGVE